MNPFEGKSLTELRDGVPGYTNLDLDALCACVCEGEWVKHVNELSFCGWARPVTFRKYTKGRIFAIWKPLYRAYTTNGQQAMRLLVEYRLNVSWTYDLKDSSKEFLCVQKALASDIPIMDCQVQKDLDSLDLICRAITETAVTAALGELIDAKPNNK